MVSLNRYRLLPLGAIASLILSGSSVRAGGFVTVDRERVTFVRDGRPYRFVGANLWYAMNLGATEGDRARLVRELDRLEALGVRNLRIVALSEGPDSEPWRIVPSAQPTAGQPREELLLGLDFALDAIRERGMTAVLCLTNFWPWSGGMAQYLTWTGEGPIPYPPPQPGGDWGVYQSFTERFYSRPRAIETFEAATRAIVTRTNRLSGLRYADDPAILAWQLANEPRGGRNTAHFNRWLERSAELIRSLDPNHLITTGTEGETPWPSSAGLDLLRNHSHPAIDYATAHVWAQNWGWYDPARAGETYAGAAASMRQYLRGLTEKARILGKPLVVEEFGLARDDGAWEPSAPTAERDRYFRDLFEEVASAAEQGAPVAGVNFWAWAGEGLPLTPGGHWQAGEPFTGDPPHEPQGWYGVYAHDVTTHDVISEFARRLGSLR